MGSVKAPTPAELIAVGKQLGMNLSEDDVKFFLETMAGNVAAYNRLETLSDHLPHVKYPRTRGHRPEPDENPYNAWYHRSEVKGAPGALTFQLILDHGADEYVLRPSANDAQVLLQLVNQSKHVMFDVERKVLMFGNISTA